MKKILFALLFFPAVVFAQTDTENYVRTLNYNEETQVSDATKANATVIYYDGMGRPIQKVEGKASPSEKDIITHIEYDGFGRERKKYMPFESTSSSLGFDVDAKLHTEQLYLTNKYENTPNPYEEVFFEESPLNRIHKKSSPGLLWKGNAGDDNDHSKKYDYQFNGVREVRRFFVLFPNGNTEQPELSTNGYYGKNQLYKTITKDENWTAADGKSRTTEEFKDKEGNIILKRNYNRVPTDEDPNIYIDVPHDTYYVYDAFSNLTFVLPPLASDKMVIEQQILSPRTVNYPWPKLIHTDGDTADRFESFTKNVSNEDILNVDYFDTFGIKGGFSIEVNDSGAVMFNINVTSATKQPYRTGVIASLDGLGNFEDKELGRIIGDDHTYIFLLKDNLIQVEGSGDVPSKILTLSNDRPNLQYIKNYPWTDVCIADAGVATKYNQDIANIPNSLILNTYTSNPYEAQGGVAVTVEEDDTVTLSVNISSNTPLELKSGSIFSILSSRSLTDMDLGSVAGSGYEYHFSIKDNKLLVDGFGFFNQLTFHGSRLMSFGYEINHDVERLCYIYHYDKRNRVIEKHIPDNGWTYIVYDKLDRPVLTQNENMRLRSINDPVDNHNWMFNKYDKYGRLAITGTVRNESTTASLRWWFDTMQEPLYEVRSTTPTVTNSMPIYYANTTGYSYGRVLTANYYDDYDFNTSFTAVTNIPMETGNSYDTFTTDVKGLATGSIVRILDNDSDPNNDKWEVSFTKYDARSRPIWTWSYNTLLTTWHGVESKLDFRGKVLETKTQHKPAGAAIVSWDYFTYDKNDRMLRHSQKIGANGNVTVLAWNKYDELGTLSEKMVGGILPSVSTAYSAYTNAWQTMNYSNNIRGWLKGINSEPTDPTAASDLFKYWVSYEGNYNGNISSTSWKLNSENTVKTYDYGYDAMNRLVTSKYTGLTSPMEKYKEGPVTYDKNGNITSLERWGYINSGLYDKIDQLVYAYKPMSNQLMTVTDYSGLNGFRDGNTSGYDYEYDSSGNMKYDLNKGIGGTAVGDWIQYNHLNLPIKIKKGANKWIEYLYDGKGKKIQKKVFDGVLTTTSDAYGYVYLNAVLEYFPNGEGYAEHTGNQNFAYIYSYKDHLGNVRLTYTKNGNNIEVRTQNDYYPFGMRHEGNNIEMPGSIANKIKYNGKELQDELGLGWYDYHARNYDPTIGRWFNIDPMAEVGRRWSSYTYCYDNPIKFIDPDGMLAMDPIFGKNFWGVVKKIGDDGKNQGKIHYVYNAAQVKDIKTKTEAGDKAIDLTGVDKVTLNGGKKTIDGVVASVDAASKDTKPGAGDAGLHEEGGDTRKNKSGGISTVAWAPGPKKGLTGHGSISLFNGVSRPPNSDVLDYWHVHTSKTQEKEMPDGTTHTFTGSMEPSGNPNGSDFESDFGVQRGMESGGFSGTAIQVGTSSGTEVNFYNGQGVITTLSFSNFKNLSQ